MYLFPMTIQFKTGISSALTLSGYLTMTPQRIKLFFTFYFSLIFSVTAQLLNILHTSKADFTADSQAIVEKVISSRFQNCEIVHVSPKITSERHISHQYLLENADTSGNFNVAINSSVSYRQVRLTDVHRYNNGNCIVGVVFIPESFDENHLSNWLFNTTTQRYAPLIRKDQDHFIFVCSSISNCDKILMSPQYGNKIKFKISISPSKSKFKSNSDFVIKTVDLYGNFGEPILKTLDSEAFDLFPDTTLTFNGKTFRVSNPRSHTYYDVERLPNGKFRGLRGLYKKWLDTVKEELNFTVDVFESSLSGGSGKLLSNGTWGGTVGDVLYGTADMGAFVGHTFIRHEVVGYSAYISYEWMFFISHKPRHYYTSTAVFRPLSFVLWIGFFISLIFMGITFKLILKSKWTFYDYVNYVFASFMEQDADIYMDITADASRMLVTFWLFYALVFSTAYRGKLVGLIAFPWSTWVPQTYEDLAYHDYRIGLHVVGKGGAADSIFSSSTSPVFKILNSRVEFFPEPTLCMREALSKDIACVLWKCHYEYGLHDGFTDKFGRSPFQFSTQTFYFLHDGYIWEKNAVFGPTIDRFGWPLLENGIVDFWLASDHKAVMDLRFDREKKLEMNGTKPLDLTPYFDNDEGPSKLMLAQFSGVFILFFVGLATGLISFSVEHWKFRKFKKRGNLDDLKTTIKPKENWLSHDASVFNLESITITKNLIDNHHTVTFEVPAKDKIELDESRRISYDTKLQLI